MAPPIQLAFVLTRDTKVPSPRAIEKAWRALDTGGLKLAVEQEEGAVLNVAFGKHSAAIMAIPAPVPGGEVEAAAQLSASRFAGFAPDLEHAAHLVIAHTPARRTDPVAQLDWLARLAGAVATGAKAAGVYFGGGGVAHGLDFVTEVLGHASPYVALWTGLSLGRLAGSRTKVSALTRGLAQAGLMELEVVGLEEDVPRLVGYAVDVALYVLRRGADIPDGDTLGMNESERLKLRYVRSPFDAKQQVCRFSLRK